MYAYRINDWEEAPRLVEMEKPQPGVGQVLVKVAGNGLCQSDLHMTHMPEAFCAPMGWKVPFTLGHEVGGWIESWGEGVTGLEQGEPVALVSPFSCGTCLECTSGFDNICSHGRVGRGYGADGGLAEFILLDSVRPLVKLNTLDPVTAGPLTDAGSTSYHAVNRVRDKLERGTTALVIGAGGLGSFAVQYLKLLTTAEIIVADVNAVALTRANEFGAAECIDTSADDLAAEVARLTGGRGAQAVLDFVGNDSTIAAGLACLAPRGSFVLIGAGDGGHAAPLFPALATKAADIYCFQGPTVADTRAVLELAEQGELHNRIEQFEFTEADIQRAYAKLASGDLIGRAVIKMGK
jgi:alcohol dehydrogenase, propanol-preferring